VVLADDLSGAAELAGAAFDLGFSAEVQQNFTPDSKAQVLAVNTHTRSLPPAQAASQFAEVGRRVLSHHPQWIYKKVDSVLRGHVALEIRALLECTGQSQAMLIPANPGKGRIIQKGQYLVNGTLLHQTHFAQDPEFPRTTSKVSALLGCAATEASIRIPNITTADQVSRHANQLDPSCLPVGAVEFFKAILKSRVSQPLNRAQHLPSSLLREGTRRLYVCGSSAAWAGGRARQCHSRNIPVLCLPPELFQHQEHPQQELLLARQAAEFLGQRGSLLVAVGPAHPPPSLDPNRLAQRLVTVVARLLSLIQVHQICVEGGATASALLQKMDWTSLPVRSVLPENLPLLAVPTPPHPILLIKPGSYPWPEALLGA